MLFIEDTRMRIMKTLLSWFLALAATVTLNGQLIGLVDDFEDGSTEGWFVGDPSHPFPPTTIATGAMGGLYRIA